MIEEDKYMEVKTVKSFPILSVIMILKYLLLITLYYFSASLKQDYVMNIVFSPETYPLKLKVPLFSKEFISVTSSAQEKKTVLILFC